jgi:hypothetical protein
MEVGDERIPALRSAGRTMRHCMLVWGLPVLLFHREQMLLRLALHCEPGVQAWSLRSMPIPP